MPHRAKRRALGLLRIEIENIRKHGFAGSFGGTVLCLNAGKSPSSGCCDTCVLLDYVPSNRKGEETPCLHIALNERGETVERLCRGRDRAYLTRQLLEWMERTAQRLEREIAQQSSPGGNLSR
ncbi:MAG: hypothetical protein ACE5IP_01880 [Terriglobia bacterium]